MLTEKDILQTLNREFPQNFRAVEFFRDGGSLSYIVSSNEGKWFLRLIRPELMGTALQALQIQLYLQKKKFPVPEIVFTKTGRPYVETVRDGESCLLVLYEFLEGAEPSDADVERVGELVGRLHQVMESYPEPLKTQDKHFFIDRYVSILMGKNHPLAQEYRFLGERLWEKVKDLPRGYCHCDLYRGNILKDQAGKLYVLDFDTSCNAFPMYDATLFCNETDYFAYSDVGFEKSQSWLRRFVRGYTKHRTLTEAEIYAFYVLHAVYHYQLQATIVEIYGVGCNEADFEEKQLDWLRSWLDKAREAVGLEV